MLWFGNQFFVLIILLNFLIAVISQSYENVMNSASILTYNSRCEWNAEMYQIAFKQNITNNCMVLTFENMEDAGEGDEWAGFV